MYKKLLSGILCVSMIGFVAIAAHAYPSRLGGWAVWPGTVSVFTQWLGVADFEKAPTTVEVTLDLIEVQVHYFNPGGNGGGIGTPFYPDLQVAVEQDLSEPVSKNGKYETTIIFEDSYLYFKLEDYLPPPPNPQWTPDVDNVDVIEMDVYIRGYSDLDDDGFVDDETAYLKANCILSEDGTAYECVTLETWGYKQKSQINPY
jgi:hypothetical protein